MKKSIILFIALVAASQLKAQSIFDKWSELNEYHHEMSQTFHPAEKDNLEPLKAKAKELTLQADKLAEAKIPMEFSTEAIKKAVTQLKVDSKAVYEKVESNKATNKELKDSIFALHDVFHEIVGLCKDEYHKQK